ncbi:protein mono-ADP-ribosyltransferase PARP9 isoform X2 [Arvicola amphibius]|uniref:protein mono-ADP-ribosyltransferase PARP9 isoform X2 n=1 Tax=Arvicola amphibius TaxID=1047088 RepID=UPI0018E3182D|nr:protein mono-ADP-ribosyltransferase PARP9 isoform X2 [Arvicola amphibius]
MDFYMDTGAAAYAERPGMIGSLSLLFKKGFAQLFPQCRRGHMEGDCLPLGGSANDSFNRWLIPVKHNVFEILKSNESQLCEVLQNKFGCISTLSCPVPAGNSAPAQQVFRRRLTSGIELSVWKDDLTRHVVDAVVNAANEELLHGSGLAGSLVKAGGIEIQEESRRLVATYGKIPTGNIAVTKAGRLPCHQIIHAVGPRWTARNGQTAVKLLGNAINSILDYVCIQNTHIKTVAVPALSSGIFQFPLDLCTQTILETIEFYLQEKQPISDLKEIHLVSNEDRTVASFKDAAERILGKNELRLGMSPGTTPSFSVESILRKDELSLWMSRGTTPSSNVTLQVGQRLTLQIVQDYIEQQTTEVIVNSVFKYDLKSGRVSQSILRQAGPEMEWELDKRRLSSDYQTVLVTRGFKLSCRYVFHVVWQHDNKHQILKDAMKSCLKNCLQLYVNSISFPALGTGGIGMEGSSAVRIMLDEILTFAKEYTKKSLTVRIVIFPADKETYKAFCAEMTKRSSELSLSSSSVPQQIRGEQRRGLEAGSSAISLTGVKVEEMCEAKKWIERLLTSEDCHIIENNHILYLGKKEHDRLSQLQTTSGVQILETVSPQKATLKIRGAQADLIEAVMHIEGMLCEVQEEVARKKEKSLRGLLGQWTNQQGILDEMEDFHTYLRYPVPLSQELEDRKRQFEKCGLWVVKVAQIQNSVLKNAFQEKKKMMEGRTPRGSGSQRLFQQVPYQFCNVVCRVGFHRLYTTPFDPVYGTGIYFTKSLKKLADKVKKTSSTDKLIYVFEAEVLTGSFCQGNNLSITPPPLSPGALDAHDSVVDNVSNPETIVVFSGTQAIPQYLWICTQDRTLSQHQMWGQDDSSELEMASSPLSWREVSNGSSV